MNLVKKKESYVSKSLRLIDEKKIPEAIGVVTEGLNDYQNQIITAMNGHPIADTALIICALRNYADALERSEPDSKPMVEWINNSMNPPQLKATKKIRKTKKR